MGFVLGFGLGLGLGSGLGSGLGLGLVLGLWLGFEEWVSTLLFQSERREKKENMKRKVKFLEIYTPPDNLYYEDYYAYEDSRVTIECSRTRK